MPVKKIRKRLLTILFAVFAFAVVFSASAETTDAAVAVFSSHTISSLTAKQRKIALSLMSYVKKGKTQDDIDYKCTVEDFMAAWYAINDSYFRYYSTINMDARRIYNNRTGKTIGVSVTLYSKDSLKSYNRHLENKSKLKSLAKSITKGKTTERAKVLAINNYVCKKLTWRDNAGTLDIALRTKYAKCTGYATLFMALCEQCSIKCCQVAGEAHGGHDWNRVRVDGVWYYIDPTWNDQTGNGYLLSKKLWRDHTQVWAYMYVINFQSCGYKFDL